MSLQEQARAYILGCLAEGISMADIEQPLGLLAEIHRHIGASADMWSVAGADWLASQ